MAVPRITISDEKLQKRLKKYEEVTKKSIASTLRRSARLMAVSLSRSTPPYGNSKGNIEGNNADLPAKQMGERAIQNDILRVYKPLKPIRSKYDSKSLSFQGTVEKYITKNLSLRNALLSAIKTSDGKRLREIVKGMPSFSRLFFDGSVDAGYHQKARNPYGRVRKKWETRIVVMDSKGVSAFIKLRQDRVGLTKAAWAACAISVKADVQDALRGIPAWVKRHASRVPHSVSDDATDDLPRITLTNKLPWADKALRKNDHAEAIRISRQKFYRSMGKEIKEALKKAAL